MKTLVFSDLHIGLAGERDAQAAMRDAFAQAQRNHGDADHYVLLGDLAAHGAASEYAALRMILADVDVPTRLILGNHDDRAAFLSVFADAKTTAQGYVQDFRDAGGHRCLFLDTLADEGHGSGHLCRQRLDWLDAALREAPGPCLIFMHHPPILTHSPACDAIGLRDKAAFRAVVARHTDRIEHILFGHCHFPVAGSVAGVSATGLASVLRQNRPNTSDNRFIPAPSSPGSYGILLGKPGDVAILVENVEPRGAQGPDGGDRNGAD